MNNRRSVADIQRALLDISRIYPDIPRVNPDGIYGEETIASVTAFQRMLGLPNTGEVDYSTWNELTELARELRREQAPARSISPFSAPLFMNQAAPGESFDLIYIIQIMLNTISVATPDEVLPVNGRFSEELADKVRSFQRQTGLPTTGSVDKPTWNRLAELYDKYVRHEI